MTYRTVDGAPLVGREDALDRLEARLRSALAGEGGLILLSGAAGIGKTCLALAIGEAAQARGAFLAVARCYERGGSPPFTLWAQVLSALSGSCDLASVPAPLGPGPRAQTPWQLMQAVTEFLQHAASQAPLVLVLEDVHWADAESLELLEFATRRIAAFPALVQVTYRVEELLRGQRLYDELPRLHRDRPVEAIRLDALAPLATLQLIESRYGLASDDLGSYVHVRSDGNPLFAVELLRHLHDRGLLGRDEHGRMLPPRGSAYSSGRTPELLEQVINGRVQRLGRDAERLLEVASVVGAVWNLQLVNDALGWGEGTVLAALETALAAKTIEPAEGDRDVYRFTHALVREVLYDRQLGRRRRVMHATLAGLLEAQGGPVGAIASHAAAAGQWGKAARYRLMAGESARERFATRTALQHFRQGLAALEYISRPDAGALGHALWERVGEAHTVLNELDQAEAAFTRMLEFAEEGEGSGRARAFSWLSLVAQRRYRLEPARTYADLALSAAEQADDRRVLSLTHWSLGHLHMVTGDLNAFEGHMRTAEQLARDSDHPDVLGRALQYLANLSVWRGDYADAQRLVEESLELARNTRDVLQLGGGWWYLGRSLGEHGRYAGARRALQAGLDHVEESGERHYLARLLNTMGWLHAEVGDVDSAVAWDEQALAVCRAGLGDPVREAERYSLLNLATDELMRRRPEVAERYLEEFEQLADTSPYARFRYINRYQLVRAELALLRGELGITMRLSKEARVLAVEKGVRKNVLKADMLRGRASLALGRPDEARQVLSAAANLAESLEHGALRWQARLWYGKACAQDGDVTTARAAWTTARERVRSVLTELEPGEQRLRFLASPLVHELESAAGTMESPRHKRTFPAGLTEREVEVLALVARGLPDREIAEALVISLRTAQTHVGSILAKTASPNRTAAAAFASRNGLI